MPAETSQLPFSQREWRRYSNYITERGTLASYPVVPAVFTHQANLLDPPWWKNTKHCAQQDNNYSRFVALRRPTRLALAHKEKHGRHTANLRSTSVREVLGFGLQTSGFEVGRALRVPACQDEQTDTDQNPPDAKGMRRQSLRTRPQHRSLAAQTPTAHVDGSS